MSYQNISAEISSETVEFLIQKVKEEVFFMQMRLSPVDVGDFSSKPAVRHRWGLSLSNFECCSSIFRDDRQRRMKIIENRLVFVEFLR